jgi:hypothetical protein
MGIGTSQLKDAFPVGSEECICCQANNWKLLLSWKKSDADKLDEFEQEVNFDIIPKKRVVSAAEIFGNSPDASSGRHHVGTASDMISE